MEFVDPIHDQLTHRDKLTAAPTHLENTTFEDVTRVSAMTTWIRQRLKLIDALISPHFLDISARSSKVDFAEPDPEKKPRAVATLVIRLHKPSTLVHRQRQEVGHSVLAAGLGKRRRVAD